MSVRFQKGKQLYASWPVAGVTDRMPLCPFLTASCGHASSRRNPTSRLLCRLLVALRILVLMTLAAGEALRPHSPAVQSP